MLEFNGTLVYLVVSFLVFMFLMNRIFYSPMTKIRNQRQDYLDEQKSIVSNNSAEIENLTSEHLKKITEARISATEIVAKANDTANANRSEIISSKKSEVNVKFEENKTQIELEKEKAGEQLRNEVVTLAQAISSSILKEDVSISSINTKQISFNSKR